jgi:hypothetical protein
MTDPYRDPEWPCPACSKPLRMYRTRLVCDACNGIMVALDDLASAVHDLTSLTPSFAWKSEQPGTRACPQCRATMTACKLIIDLDGAIEHPKPVLDRCEKHGLWFDHEELAMVFEKIATKGFGGAIGRTSKVRDGAPVEMGQWSAVFKNRSGGWGGF